MWFGSSLSIRIDESNICRFDLWLFEVLNSPVMSDFNKALVGMICWQLWKHRCSHVFENIPLSPVFVINQAAVCLSEMWNANGWHGNSQSDVKGSGDRNTLWQPPVGNGIKVNVDGAFKEGNHAGIGIVLRDNAGLLLDCFAMQVHASSPLMSEALAVKKGL